MIDDKNRKLVEKCFIDALSELKELEQASNEPLSDEIVEACIRYKIACLLKTLNQEDKDNAYQTIRHNIDKELTQTRTNITFLSDATGHEAWLTHERINTIKWEHWHAYRNYLIEEHAKEDQIISLQETTFKILAKLEDPERPAPWDTRGLVVGDVQAGKTSNYIGLLAKAIDAGYKFIIILAGMTSDLRLQTQKRIDAGLLGRSTATQGEHGIIKGKGFPGKIIIPMTMASVKGDFNKGASSSFQPISEDNCYLYVVKKNVSVLRNLYKDLQSKVENGHKISQPLIMIDDEADNASLNGKMVEYDLFTNKPVDQDEINPTAINRFIRAILCCFSRSAYIGYTATPFANLFGVPDIEKELSFYDAHLKQEVKIGEDLFPRSFVSYLKSPASYYGPERIFGFSYDDEKRIPVVVNINEKFPNDLTYIDKNGKETKQPFSVKYTTKGKKLIPNKLKPLKEMPESMKYSIRAFILASIVRRKRKGFDDIVHNTMLIHIDRYTAVHGKLKEWVNDYIDEMKTLFDTGEPAEHSEFMNDMKDIWEKEFKAKEQAFLSMVDDPDIVPYEWDNISDTIPIILREISCVIVNGTKEGQNLDYDNAKNSLTVIAIGGDKLARGLTLEGLTTSYFLRSSKLFDSLSQMGRWFGYRNGYIDVCRIYANSQILSFFEEVAESSYDLKQQFEELRTKENMTPRKFGFRVRTRPSSAMEITAKSKSPNKHNLKYSFSDCAVPTAYVPNDPEYNEKNYKVFTSFIEKMGSPSGYGRNVQTESRNKKSVRWEKVNLNLIIEEFLKKVYVDEANFKFPASGIEDYIHRMNKKGELQNWTVALISGDGKETELNPYIKIRQSQRKIEMARTTCYELDRRRLPTGNDESFDLTIEQFNKALMETNKLRKQNGKNETNTPAPHEIRKIRGADRCLLLLYLLEIETVNKEKIYGIPGFMISFPESNDPDADAEYLMNNVYAKNLKIDEANGNAEEEDD